MQARDKWKNYLETHLKINVSKRRRCHEHLIQAEALIGGKVVTTRLLSSKFRMGLKTSLVDSTKVELDGYKSLKIPAF